MSSKTAKRVANRFDEANFEVAPKKGKRKDSDDDVPRHQSNKIIDPYRKIAEEARLVKEKQQHEEEIRKRTVEREERAKAALVRREEEAKIQAEKNKKKMDKETQKAKEKAIQKRKEQGTRWKENLRAYLPFILVAGLFSMITLMKYYEDTYGRFFGRRSDIDMTDVILTSKLRSLHLR